MKPIKIFFAECYYYETTMSPKAVGSTINKMIDASSELEGSCAGGAFKFRYFQNRNYNRTANNAARIKGEIHVSTVGKTTVSIRVWPGYSFIYYSLGIAFFAFAVTEGMWQGPNPAKALALAGLIIFLYLFSWFYAFQSKALIRANFEDALGVKPITPQT